MPYTYILQCADGTYYTGSAVDIKRRLAQHQAGKGAKYTRQRLPVRLCYFEEYPAIGQAFRREKQVQSWSRAKKEALIEGRDKDLPGLAKKVFRKRTPG